MNFFSIILIIAGLCLFETISSIDNAIINSEILSKVGENTKRWFLGWGLVISVFLVRGFLPWAIVWVTAPALGPIGAFTATFSSNPQVHEAIKKASPILLIGGGVFLLFLFFSWLFLEEKHYGLMAEQFFQKQAVWFFAVVSVVLAIIVWFALQVNSLMAFGAVLGSTAFFITHGFRENAEKQEKEMLRKETKISDASKLFFLLIIDATFSLDGVLGSFAFTLSVPLILIGNGLGAVVVRKLTASNIERIKRYIYLKNGALYSIGVLGTIMILESFGYAIAPWVSPLVTFIIVGYFFLKSKKAIS